MKVDRTRVFFAITAAGAFLAISGCSSGGGQNVMASAPAGPAKPGITLACPGRVEGRSETFEIGAGADGLVKAVYVKEGQRVARGTKLAEIDCPDLQASLQEAISQIESARQVKARLLRGSRDVALGQRVRDEVRQKLARPAPLSRSQFLDLVRNFRIDPARHVGFCHHRLL